MLNFSLAPPCKCKYKVNIKSESPQCINIPPMVTLGSSTASNRGHGVRGKSEAKYGEGGGMMLRMVTIKLILPQLTPGF